MIEFDEEYNDFLSGTSVRYEMYVRKDETESEINNYKSVQYFSNNDGVSVGFFGMATCEFEMEKKELMYGDYVKVMTATPEKMELQKVNDLVVLGTDFGEYDNEIVKLIKNIGWSSNSRYEAVPLLALKNSGTNEYYVYHIGIGDNYSYPEKITINENELIVFEANANGTLVQRTRVYYDSELEKWVIGNNTSGNYKQIQLTNVIEICMFANFTYTENGLETDYTAELGNMEKPKEFTVFTGIVKDLKNENGIYKVYCNDLSELLDVELTAKEKASLSKAALSYNEVLNDYIMNDKISAWSADELRQPYLFNDVKRFQYYNVEGITKRQIVENISAQNGSCAYMNHEGTLVIKWYGGTMPMENTLIVDEQLYEDGVVYGEEDTEFNIGKLTVVYDPGINVSASGLSYSYGEGDEIVLYFKNCSYSQINGNMIKELFENSISRWTQFINSELQMVGNFRIEPGDLLNYPVYDESAQSEVFKSVPVMCVEHECDGGLLTKIYSYGRKEGESDKTEGNQSYTGGNQSTQVISQNVIGLQERIDDLEKKAVLSVKLNGNELNSGTTATIPMASDSQDGALSKELYSEITSEITTEQIDEWFGEQIETSVYGNYTTELEVEPAMATAITGEEVSDD